MPPFHCLKDKIKNTKNHFYFKKVDANIFFFLKAEGIQAK